MSGFWLLEERLGEVHITGDLNMSEQTLELLMKMLDVAVSEIETQPDETGRDDD